MSQLGDLENALVTRLTAATLVGSPVFQTVRGVSGGFRSAIREAIRRERMPAAYVAFTDEPTAPEVKAAARGARFVVLVADRALRVESDPRHGDVNSLGAFTSLEQARLELDGYEPVGGLRLLNLHQKFVEADDRVAVYELLYRVWPVTVGPFLFAGQAIAGNTSLLSLVVDPVEVERSDFRFPGLNGVYHHVLGVRARSIIWRGRIRGEDDAAVDAIEADVDAAVLSQTVGDITIGSTQVFPDCVLDRYVRNGSRRLDGDGLTVCQDAELFFSQLSVPVTEQA